MPKRAKVHECNASMVYDLGNLAKAHKNAQKGKGFYKEVKMVNQNQGKYLCELSDMERNGTYRTSEYEHFQKNDGRKVREISKLPYYPDRIHQWAIIQVIEPFLIRNMTKDTYSAIPGRGVQAAYEAVRKSLRTDFENTQWCLKIDIRKYYPSIPKDKLKETYERLFKDRELLEMIFEIIDSTPGDCGVPIGNYVSQYSGNIYLSCFDHMVKENWGVKHYFRYMDDMVFLAKSKEFLQRLVTRVTAFLERFLGLEVKKSWSLFFVEDRGIDFVGYVFRHGVIRLRKSIVKTLRRLCLNVRRRARRGHLINYSMYCAFGSLTGWLGHCNSAGLRRRYVMPIEHKMTEYHLKVIRGNKNGGLKKCA